MDALTHVLAPVLITEPLSYERFPVAAYAQWRERLAVILAALLPDADGLLGFVSLDLYARYHRVATHSIFGFVFLAFVAALIAHAWPSNILPPSLHLKEESDAWIHPGFKRLFAFALIAVAFHFVGDAITAWGTLRFLWPIFPEMDFQLSWVNSLEMPMPILTGGAWAVQHYFIVQRAKRAAWFTVLVWFLLVVAFIILRQFFGLTYT